MKTKINWSDFHESQHNLDFMLCKGEQDKLTENELIDFNVYIKQMYLASEHIREIADKAIKRFQK